MSSFQQSLIREYAKAAADLLSAEAIGHLVTLPATLSGDGSGLENVWEEICVQVQGEESIFWDAYTEVMNGAVLGAIQKLEIPARDLAAIWLQSDEGWDWHWDREWEEGQRKRSERASGASPIPFVLDRIADYVVDNYLKPAAEDFSNENIESFLSRR